MPRINTYVSDTTITANDKLIGTDQDNNNRTVNITIDSIKEYVEDNADFVASTTTYVQSIASDSWAITHNLGKFPSVYTVDNSDGVMVGEIIHQNNNKLTITFSAPVTGTAYLN